MRTGQRVYPSIYLTTKQAAEVDRYRSSTPATCGCTLDDFARKKRLIEAIWGRAPTADELIRAVDDDVPATAAQMSYATGVGLRIPTAAATKNRLGYILSCYECVKRDLQYLWEEVYRDQPSGVPFSSHEVGYLVSDLLDDPRFAQAVAGKRDLEAAIESKRVRALIKAHMRRLWP